MEDRVTAHLATVLSFDWISNNNNNNNKLRYEIGVYGTGFKKKKTDIRFLLTRFLFHLKPRRRMRQMGTLVDNWMAAAEEE